MKPGEEEKKTHYIVSYLDNQIKSAKQLSVDRLQQQELCGGSVETEVVCIELGFAWWKKGKQQKDNTTKSRAETGLANVPRFSHLIL